MTNERPIDETKAFWNERAAQFYKNQQKGRDETPERVAHHLTIRGFLVDDSTVLDVGSGSGRYTIPFAQKALHVTALDVSDAMLDFLKKEAASRDVSNIATIESPWPTKEPLGSYDLVFAAMCPAVRSEASLRQMDDCASEAVVIARYNETTDSILQQLHEVDREQLFEGDPHNDRKMIDDLEQIAKNDLDRVPHRHIIKEVRSERLPVEEAKARYARYEKKAPVIYEQLMALVDERTEDGIVPVQKRTELTLLYWEV